MNGIETLPPWVQVVASLLIFGAAGFAWFRGAIKSVAGETKDVVVPGLAIADGEAIRLLATEIRELNRTRREEQDHLRNLIWEVQHMSRHLEGIKHSVRNMEQSHH